MPLSAEAREERAVWLRLVLTPGIGPAAVRRLLEAFGLPEDIFAAGRAKLTAALDGARAQALLGAEVRLVSAFHNVAAHKLATDEEVDCDVLVFGDDKGARAVAVELAQQAGLRGLHAGALANAAAAEALTSILIFMNKTYRVDGAGIRITGQLDMDAASA